MKNRALLLSALVCLCLSTPQLGQAQELVPGTSRQEVKATPALSGILLDSVTAEPVEYATVTLLQPATQKILSATTTDLQGKFTLGGVAPGKYRLSFSLIGYQTKTLPHVAVIETNQTTQLGKIWLSPALYSSKEVTVEALRPTIVQEADKMVVSVEGSALVAGRTAFDVLSVAPGVYVDQDGNIQLNGRSGVTVMVDGKLTYLSGRDLRSMLESMPAANLKNLEIITNPSARFDAEGSSGILNINLRKNERQGVNGSVYSGYNTNWKQQGFSVGGILNHKSGRWNSFLNLDMARRAGGRDATFTRVFRGDSSTVYFDQVADGNFRTLGPPSVRIGTDYQLTDKHSVGIMSNFVSNKLHGNFLTETYLGTTLDQPSQFIDAQNFNSNLFTSLTGNVHYLGKLDTLGKTLSADLDVVRITNRGDASFYNYYYSLAPGGGSALDQLYTSTPNGYNIFAAKVDYVLPLSLAHKLEMGAKASYVEADNDSRFYFNNSDLVLDLRRTNHFVYDENIFASYVSWNGKLSERYKLQAGLRAEQTRSIGESLTTGQRTKRSYLNLFPSLFLQQKVTDNYSINYNYSHRINRPNYGSLNPFLAYRDPYTYWQGNPYLRPQYSHVVGITQVFRKVYHLVLNYQYNTDLIAELPAVDAATATTIYYMGNVSDAQNLSVTAIVPVKVMNKWETNNTLTTSYNEYSNILEGKQVITHQTNYMVQSNHTIMLPFKLKMELNGVYQSKAVHALYEIEPRWWLNAGLKRSFMKDKLDLTLNVNDIFRTQHLVISARVGEGNVSDWDQYFRQQSLSFQLRYKFSSGIKVEDQRQNNSLEELNRTR